LFAWYRGFWAAAFSVAISSWAGFQFILIDDAAGILSSGRTGRVAILGFMITSLVVSYLIDFQRRTLLRARAAERAQAIIAAENARLLEETKLAAVQLKQSNEELLRANRDLELFAYSASHDLQEPLRTISLSAQLIERKMFQRQSREDLVQQIVVSARRMNFLIQDVLAYIGAATTDSEAPPVIESGRVLNEVLKQLQASIAESGAIVTAGELPAVAMHENRLAQVLQNLISNAIKYRKSEPPHVLIKACERNDSWEFSVVDNGIGIDPEFSEEIFGLFKRLHNQEQYPGSGIGLAICQRIVEQGGGRIWLAESEPGKGSTFCFTIPINRN
jgi:light-regulated signal transduction histidine kinase (bacteriophytochrome)